MESIYNKRAARAATTAAEISEQMTLGRDTVEKIEAIEDDERVRDMGNLTKTRMAGMLDMYGKTVRLQTAKETFLLDCMVELNASGVLKNYAVV